MLRLDGVRARQGAFTLTAEIEIAAATTAVMGPSGGGKSTLLAVVAGFVDATAGRISWDGRDITAAPPGDRPVAILFQEGNLFPHLTVAQNVGLGLHPSLRLREGQVRAVAAALAQVGLGGMGARRPAALSGGQQSRAALARVLLMDRPLVLLDEPFAALGPGLRAEMLDLAAGTLRAAGRTLMIVTHDPDDAERIADEIVVVDGGRAQPPVPTKDLLSDPPQSLRDYLGR